MKYKVGDKVRVKSKEWYDENKDQDGFVNCVYIPFVSHMAKYLGKEVTIKEEGLWYYNIVEDDMQHYWTDEMFDGLANSMEQTTENGSMREGTNEGINHKEPYLILEAFKDPTNFETNLDLVLGDLRAFLLEKHSRYGSFYETPLNKLLTLSTRDRILARIEEKIGRILAGSKDEDTLKDIVGLYIQLKISEIDKKENL